MLRVVCGNDNSDSGDGIFESLSLQSKNEVIQRIDWVDIFKGICMIFVVLGHCSGKYSGWIYSFHVAAFFFISGYTSNLKKYSFGEQLARKSYQLLLPFVTMLVFFSTLIGIIDYCDGKIKWYDLSILPFSCITNYLTYNVAPWAIGAMWFVIALFMVFVITSILKIISRDNYIVYLVLSLLTYLFGIYINNHHYYSQFYIDVALVLQLFFTMGNAVKYYRIIDIIESKKEVFFLFGLIMSFIWFYMGYVKIPVPDYSERILIGYLKTAIYPLFGIFMLYFISKLFSDYTRRVKQMLIVVGKNTLGVLIFHFVMFKLVTYAFIAAGVVSIDSLAAFPVPAEVIDLNVSISFIYTTVAVVLSTLIWIVLMRIKFISYILGANKINCMVKIGHISNKN